MRAASLAPRGPIQVEAPHHMLRVCSVRQDFRRQSNQRSDVKVNTLSVSGGWEAVQQRALGGQSTTKHMALARARLTMAATVAWAISLLPETSQVEMEARGRGRDGRLLLWLVGARQAMEGELVRNGHFAEPLRRLCPTLLVQRGLELVLIGPEMQAWELVLEGAPVPTLVRALPGTLHSEETAGEPPPDIIVLFNSGIGTLIWPLVEAWLPSISAMLQLNVPILLTCFHEGEAEGEQIVLENTFKARVLVPSTRNPFAHVTPLEAVASGGVNAPDEVGLAERVAEAAASASVARVRVVPKNADLASGSSTCAPNGTEHPDPEALSNSFVWWICGSSLAPSELDGSAQERAAGVVRGCAKMFALKQMDSWLACLDADATSAVVERGEVVAANCMLFAEATDEGALALLAHQKGVDKALKQVLRLWTPVWRSSHNGSYTPRDPAAAAQTLVGSSPVPARGSPSYAGMPSVERIMVAATASITNIERYVREVVALQSAPTGEATPLAEGHSVWRNVFGGQYVNVRSQPSTTSTVVARVPKGVLLTADAELFGWLRLTQCEEQGVPASSWVLVRHPAHGNLLEQA